MRNPIFQFAWQSLIQKDKSLKLVGKKRALLSFFGLHWQSNQHG